MDPDHKPDIQPVQLHTLHATPVQMPTPNSQPDPQMPNSKTPNLLLQQTLNPEKANYPWGNTMIFNSSTHNFCVVSKNTGTLSPLTLDMLAITDKLMYKGVSVFAAQETNIDWTPTMTLQIISQARRIMPYLTLATSSSIEDVLQWYKPGGTFILALNHWMSHFISQGTDTPLGQWSFLELSGQAGKCVIIILAYQVCHQNFDVASDTALAQQI